MAVAGDPAGPSSAKALRKLVRSIVVARQTDLFEARQAIEDLLGLLADTAERNRTDGSRRAALHGAAR